MNAQEIFDTVASHLLHQNKQCKGEDGYCKYRNSEGLKCAIGALIPEDKYSLKMEEEPITCVMEGVLDWFTHHNLLMDLQKCHDTLDPKDWKSELYQISAKHGLVTEVLNDF